MENDDDDQQKIFSKLFIATIITFAVLTFFLTNNLYETFMSTITYTFFLMIVWSYF